MRIRRRLRSQARDKRAPGVVLLHGIGRTSRYLGKLDCALQAAGFATLNVDYASRKRALDALAADIHPAVSAFAATTDGPIHFVGHSMGGLVTRVYLARYRPAQLGRVVMLGTPNGGSELADLLKGLAIYRAFYGPAGLQLSTDLDPVLTSLPPPDYAVGIIAGDRPLEPIASSLILPRPNDGCVSVASSKLANMTDHITVRTSHPGLVRNRVAIEQVVAFLREGRFRSPETLRDAA
jgi:pimeloyl-ACP methyl ester carboxylesterase